MTTDEQSPMVVLVVDDDPLNRHIVGRLLEKRGHIVHFAANGRDAIAAVRARAFDLMILDCQMPDLDGFETAAVIRHSLPERALPIVALTGEVNFHVAQRCKEAGIDAFLAKPISTELLDEHLAFWRHQRSPYRADHHVPLGEPGMRAE